MDTTIIAVFVISDDILRGLGHKDDPRARVTDAEVITTAITAMLYFGGNFEHARTFMREMGYIPHMLSKSRFNRRIHRLAPWIKLIFSVLGDMWKEWNEDSVYVLDTFPIPVCDNIRIPRCKLYQEESFRGYVASKRRFYYGLKLHLLVTKHGQPVEFFLTPASWADIRGLDMFDFDLPDGSTLYADRGYVDYHREDFLQDAGLDFLPMRKKNSKRPLPPWTRYLQHVFRKIVETSGSLLNRFMPKNIHAVTPQGFELKIALFVLALSFSFLNGTTK